MQIIVDDQPYASRGPDTQTVQALANEVCAVTDSAQQRLVVSLTCDDQPVVGDNVQVVLDSRVRDHQKIELQTVSVAEQVFETLTQAIGVFAQCDAAREQAADALNAGRHAAAMENLQKLLEILRQIQQTTVMSSQLIGVSLEELRIEGQGIEQILGVIKDHLNALKDGMESQDFVLVSDILRYEFHEPLARWSGILNYLRTQAQARL